MPESQIHCGSNNRAAAATIVVAAMTAAAATREVVPFWRISRRDEAGGGDLSGRLRVAKATRRLWGKACRTRGPCANHHRVADGGAGIGQQQQRHGGGGSVVRSGWAAAAAWERRHPGRAAAGRTQELRGAFP